MSNRSRYWRHALWAALGGTLTIAATTAIAQVAAPTSQPALEEIVVTGSMIKRTDTETPSPVQIISAQDLVNSGFTSVSQVLNTLSANGSGTLSQSFNGAFASGGSGVSLRGLTVGNTLTLIDGYRMVGYPLTDDGERSFVDVTAIPFNAVERIEVLKDGASAEYGSDAVAGVVNIILKKSYVGAELGAEYGDSQHHDGALYHLTGIWGTGDLDSDGHNLYVSAEYRRQDAIPFANRAGEQFTTENFTGVGGLNGTPGAGNNPLVPFPASKTGYLINPATQAQAFLPGCTQALQAASGCTFQLTGSNIQPPTSSANVLSKFTVNLPGSWQSITTASIFETKAQQSGAAYNSTAYPSGPTVIGLPPGGLPNVKIYSPITVPANYPGNPFGTPADLVYSFGELGLPFLQVKTDTYRFVQEVKGQAGGWDITASAGYMYSILSQDSFGDYLPGTLQTALNNGYVLGSSSGAAQFAPVAQTTDSSNLMYGNAHASHALLPLPGGDLAMALGTEWFEQKLNAPAAPTSVNGTQVGLNDAWAIGSQADTAGFLELNAPILKNLEANAAVRYDHYNTSAGGATTPKFGVKYTPIEQLAFRGTWGKGFRAPTIPETASGSAFQAGTIPDPILCPTGNPKAAGTFPSQCSVAVTGLQNGNPNLQPEKTTNFTLGVIFEPSKAFSVSVDYYNIKINQSIISAFEAGGLGINAVSTQRLGPLVNLPQVQPNGSIANGLTSVPLITYNAYPYINASQTQTDGIDIDMRSGFDIGAAGHLSTEFSWTRILVYKLEALGVDYELAGTQGPSGISGDTGTPKSRGTLSLTWDKGPMSITGTVNYISNFNVTDPSSGQFNCATAVYDNFSEEYGNKFATGSSFPGSYCNVGSFTDVDLYGQYKFGDHLSVHASVTDLFNKPPPFDSVTYGGGGGAAYSAGLEQIGAVGRFVTIGANYKF
jgi:iron complex outermembrane receptor protein